MDDTNGCLTEAQVEAITNAWLDLSTTSEMFNGESPIDKSAWQEMAVATKDRSEELEKEFPFLLEKEE